MNDPIELFGLDRSRARELGDPLVDRCFVSSVDADGNPQARTLVLRDIDGEHALFCNATSRKVEEFRNSKSIAVLVFWPSIQIQYRLSVHVSSLNHEIVRSHWQLKPPITKRLDWFYENHPQSSEIASRDCLLRAISDMDDVTDAPPSTMGLRFQPVLVERLALDTDEGIHDRRRYALVDGNWIVKTLVP